jgi:CBS domain-containing protein
MNIAFFLLPKQEVSYVTVDSTLRQTLEKMEHHRFTSIPIIDTDGGYYGTVTEGDLLWFMKNNPEVTFETTNRVRLVDVQMNTLIQPVQIDSRMENLLKLAKRQNFGPVIDDMSRFIGIVRRSDILDYCDSLLTSANMADLDAAASVKHN